MDTLVLVGLSIPVAVRLLYALGVAIWRRDPMKGRWVLVGLVLVGFVAALRLRIYVDDQRYRRDRDASLRGMFCEHPREPVMALHCAPGTRFASLVADRWTVGVDVGRDRYAVVTTRLPEVERYTVWFYDASDQVVAHRDVTAVELVVVRDANMGRATHVALAPTARPHDIVARSPLH